MRDVIGWLQTEQGKWADKTFGAHRDPTRTLLHLRREVDEVLAQPNDVVEYADCLMLLIDAARRAGIDWHDVTRAAIVKFRENKRRQWGPADDEGVMEHVR